MSVSENNKRIAKNTFILYGRTIIIMLISLYTTRVILDVLGVNDFGIYNVVGGVVSMAALINQSMTSATQRFLNFELGKNNADRLRQIFSVSLIIHFALAFIILILGETIGLWFLNTQMNIAADRMVAANWVYQCSLATFIVNLISVPYNATIIANEKMNVFAYISVLNVTLQLVIVFLLKWILFDKLIAYAILMLLVALMVRLIYGWYCSRHFQECSFVICREKSLYKEMIEFAGWTFVGSSSGILMGQGVNILMNIFYGVAVNAARGISMQVQHAITSFISNFNTAINPQITKSYASGEHKYMVFLVQKSSKISFFLLLLLSLPVLLDTQTILSIWLKTVPDYTVIFLRLALLYSLLRSFSSTLITSVSATGKIKKYQLIVGGIQSLNFPIALLFLYYGFEPYVAYIIAIVLEFFCLVSRLCLCRKLIGLSIKYYLTNVVFNALFVAGLSAVIPVLLYNSMDAGIIRLILTISISILSCSFAILYVGCSNNERKWILAKIPIFRKD
jgi:O-antigen/teichoic acid export membrane protein